MAIKINIYFYFIFSVWIPDVELKYDIGFYYMYFLITIFVVNISVVFYELYTEARKIRKKQTFIKKWGEYIKTHLGLIEELLSK